MERVETEGVVSRAVRLLTSSNGSARVGCSRCGEVALRMAGDAAVGCGSWTPVPDASARLLETRTGTEAGKGFISHRQWVLFVPPGAIVLPAQQVVVAGLAHDMKGGGFKRTLTSTTYHECRACATTPDHALQLRVDARTSPGATVADLPPDGEMIRVRCASCPCVIHEGRLKVPESREQKRPKTPPTRVQRLKVPESREQKRPKTPPTRVQTDARMCAMGGLPEPGDVSKAVHHAQLLHFSLGTDTHQEAGVLVWVVDQNIPVVQLGGPSGVLGQPAECHSLAIGNQNIPVVQLGGPSGVLGQPAECHSLATVNQKCAGGVLGQPAECHSLATVNQKCAAHPTEYPTPCGVCFKSILRETLATTVDGINGPVRPSHESG
jgi:hypothetical protein